MADSPEGCLSVQHQVTEHHVHTPDGCPFTVSAFCVISPMGLSGIC